LTNDVTLMENFKCP